MDDKKITEEKQPQPIFESVRTEEESIPQTNENIQPEEIPEDVNIAESQPPPPIYEENKSKYLVIIGGAIIFLLLFIFILRYFLSGGGSPAKEVNLTYWGLWEDQETVDPLIKVYVQQNKNVKIKYEKMSPQEYLQKLLVRGREGAGPDIFRYHNTWLPQIEEVIAPLPDKVMSAAEFEKTFYPVHQKDLKIGNSYYGIPLEIDGLVLITNDDLLRKAGVIALPSNWDELIDDAAKLTVKKTDGQIITSGIAIGTVANVDFFSDIFGWMLLQNGGDLKRLDQKEAADILSSYRKFAEPPNNFWDESMPNSTTAFIEGNVAMIIAPSWLILNIKAAKPDISLKVGSLPVVPGSKSVGLATYWVEGVSRFSKNQLEAWKFLHYLVQKDNLTKLYENSVKNRLFGEPYSRVDLAPELVQNEYIGPVIQQAKDLQSIPVVSRTYDKGLNDQIITYIENAIRAATNGVAYEQAMKTASDGVRQVFEQYKIE